MWQLATFRDDTEFFQFLALSLPDYAVVSGGWRRWSEFDRSQPFDLGGSTLEPSTGITSI